VRSDPARRARASARAPVDGCSRARAPDSLSASAGRCPRPPRTRRGWKLDDVLQELPITALVLAAQDVDLDVDLDAEPDHEVEPVDAPAAPT
jgi:hypothetical protein